MTNEELNTALYKKVFAEQEKYREWLLSQPPNEILNRCFFRDQMISGAAGKM